MSNHDILPAHRHGKTLLVTGGSGYLGLMIIEEILSAGVFDRVVIVDIRPPDRTWMEKYANSAVYEEVDVSNFNKLRSVFVRYGPHTVMHMAWAFNPMHNKRRQREIDIGGTENVFECAAQTGVKKVICMGSTTATVNIKNSDNVVISEGMPVVGSRRYLYSLHKAEADDMAQEYMRCYKNIVWTVFRGAIVFGKNIRKSVVTEMADWYLPGLKKYMFKDWTRNPIMQFLSEDDFVMYMVKAVLEDHPGVFNLASRGVMRYSDVIRGLGKKPLPLPAFILYPATRFLWWLRLCPYPDGIIDLIRCSWVGDLSCLISQFGCAPKKTTQEAFTEFVESRNKKIS